MATVSPSVQRYPDEQQQHKMAKPAASPSLHQSYPAVVDDTAAAAVTSAAAAMNSTSGCPRRRPHVLLLPYPFQGHIAPMIDLAFKLASSFHVSATFLTTHHTLFRFLQAAKLTQASSLHHFLSSDDPIAPVSFHYRWTQLGYGADSAAAEMRLVGIPDGFAVEHDRSTLSAKYMRTLDVYLESGVEAFLTNSGGGGGHGETTCIISDCFLSWSHGVAKRRGIPCAFLWTMSMAVASAYSSIPSLGYDPFTEQATFRGQLSPSMVAAFPGLPPMDPYDLPFYRGSLEEELMPWISQQLRQQFSRINDADWVLGNTFDALEESTLQALKPSIPKMLLVGPLNVIQHLDGGSKNGSSSVRCQQFRASMLEYDTECMAWLDTKPTSSVLFISFGSLHSLSTDAIAIICKALLNVCHKAAAEEVHCLWVCRAWEKEMFPTEFWAEMVEESGRVKVVNWAPQVDVLSHSAVGGFMSHMGWNSTLESLSMGVPFICCPAFMDQCTNAWCAVYRWKVGVELHPHRDEELRLNGLEAAIRCLMVEQKGAELRQAAASVKEAARRAWEASGSSQKNLELFARFLNETVK